MFTSPWGLLPEEGSLNEHKLLEPDHGDYAIENTAKFLPRRTVDDLMPIADDEDVVEGGVRELNGALDTVFCHLC